MNASHRFLSTSSKEGSSKPAIPKAERQELWIQGCQVQILGLPLKRPETLEKTYLPEDKVSI